MASRFNVEVFMGGLTPGGGLPLRALGKVRHVALFSALLAGAGGCSPLPRTHAASSAALPADWAYEVRLEEGGNLAVDAVFSLRNAATLVVEDGAEPFVDAVAVEREGQYFTVSRNGAGWSSDCGIPCRVRYRFRLKEAALALRDVDLAIAAGDAWFAPPSTWLLHPDGAGAGTYRFHVEVPPGRQFVTGVRPKPGEPPRTFAAPIDRFDESSFAGFGDFGVHELTASGVTLAIARGTGIDDAAYVTWAEAQIAAVDRYVGRVGDGRAAVFLIPGTSDANRGETLGGGGVSIMMRVGSAANAARLGDDWVLPHEMIHARFPSVYRKHTWFAEGLASYAEPVARVRAGLLTPEKMWGDLVEGMPQGLPGPADRGLDGTREWGRVYWGGALFFLVADVRIGQQTAGKKSLEDALHAVTASGANDEVVWEIARIIEKADEGTGTRVFHDLYEEMALAPGSEDLGRLWARLGVVGQGKSVSFDDSAALAAVRRSITARRSSPSP